ncbi:MAG TPA: ABC transporter ATP-binding protein [Gemmatimonadaceae bacterium]|nr:ABC transporter ATP-binding protein [Gemmatimonadaceae bacterium]
MSNDLAVSVRGLRKRYADVVAVDGLDLEIATGECFGLLGPNGAGKTTTVEICEGLTTPDEGDVVILGRRWATDDRELRERLGIQLQETQLAEKLTVSETLKLFRSFYQRGRPVDDVIRLVQLDEKRDGRVGKLSGGQKQRLALACAIVGDPDLLFLDEPTTGLDPQSRRQIWELVEEFKSMGRSILLTTHYMDEAERLCDRVAIVDHGRVIALGTPRELISSLGAEHVVEFVLVHGGNGEGLREETLRAMDGVRGVRRSGAENNGNAWELRSSELHRSVPALLAELTKQDLQLAQLRTHSATLEDVFVHLTGRQLRDE